MGVYTTPAQLAMAQRARFAAVGSNMRRVHEMLAKEGFKEFKTQTTGTISLKESAALGYLYARRKTALAGSARGAKARVSGVGLKGQIRRSGMVNRLPINKQTGRLHFGIRLDGPSGLQRTYRLYSAAPHAKYALAVDGTKQVVPRGLLGPKGRLRKVHLAMRHTAIDVLRKSHRSSVP